jgi:hypothetical protein
MDAGLLIDAGPGVFFELEKAGEDSRWNTLRARVLKWWEQGRPS